MSKLYKDPITGRFAKRPVNPASSSDVASSSTPRLLIFPTPRSHPIPGSFDSSRSPVPSLDASNTDDTARQGIRSPDKPLSLPAFFDALHRARSSSPSSPPSEPPSGFSDETETLVPFLHLVVDSLTQIDSADKEDPSLTFADPLPPQASSSSPPSYSTSLVSSATTSLPSSLLPSTSPSPPPSDPPSCRHPSPPQPASSSDQQPPPTPAPPAHRHLPPPQPANPIGQPPPLPVANPLVTAPPPQNQPLMANQANGIAGMPGPRSVNMPGFSKDGTVAFPDFLHEYEALARANGLTNLQKVESIVRYVSLELRRFWRSLDGFDPPLWNTFHAALVDMYPDTSAATRVTKRNLRELIRKSREYRMRDEEDVMRYYRQFLKLTNPLRTTGSLSDESRNTKFFKGFHHEDREVLSSRIFSMHPNHPRDTPYELKDVFKAARDYFSNAQFYCPIQRRLYDNDEAGYDSDSDSDPGSDFGLNHRHTTNSCHRRRDDNDQRNRDSRRGNDRYEFDSHCDRGLSDRHHPNDSRERDSHHDHPRHDA